MALGDKRILVTGGAGFIGSHVVDFLKIRNNVVVLDDLTAGRRKNIPGTRLIRKSVAKVQKSDIQNFDIIVHCAAQVSTFLSVDYPYEDFKSNCLGTFKLFEAWRKWNDNASILYTSSRSVLGNIPEPKIANETFPPDPRTFYNVHKLYGEHLCKIYSELYGLRFVILRPSNVYGPRQPYWKEGWYNFIAFWIKLALENRPIPIYGTGQQIRDYVYVGDTAHAYVLALENRKAIGETFLLATNRGVSLIELANKVIQITGSNSKIQFLPARKGDIPRFVGSYEKVQSVLEWIPQISLEEGLKREVDWMKSEPRKKS